MTDEKPKPIIDYAIMRCKKLKSRACVTAALDHLYRERDVPNADPVRFPLNIYKLGKSTDETCDRIDALLPAKRRRDAVTVVEYLMTASPQWWKKASREEQRKFFEVSAKWLVDKYGKENIVALGVHRDETSPHVSAFVVPITKDGRLSAKEYIGGRQKLRADQNSFAQAMEPLHLHRGVEGSKATHKTIKKYYGEMAKMEETIELNVSEALRKERLKTEAEKKATAEKTRAAAEKFAAQMRGEVKKEQQARAVALQAAQEALNRAEVAETRCERLQAAVLARDKQIEDLTAENRELRGDDDHDLSM